MHNPLSFAARPGKAQPGEDSFLIDGAELLPDDHSALMPIGLDLGDPASLASLRTIDIGWPQVPPGQRAHWLESLRVALPVRPVTTGDIALLPGGIVVVRHAEAILVCDPLASVTLRDIEARQVRRALANRGDVTTLLHTEDGVIRRSGLPNLLPPQSVSILPDGGRLPGQPGCGGPAVIQWFAAGATVWPLVPAPSSLSLVAGITAVRVAENAPPVAAEFWHAADADSRLHFVATGLVAYLSDLLAAELSDDLRFALADLCVCGSDSLATRLADALAAIPACFLGDPAALPGEPPASWNTGVALLRGARRPHVLLGVEACREPRNIVDALREAVPDATALMFHETRNGQRGITAPLDSDSALFVVQWAGAGGRIGVLLEPRQAPLELYALASGVAHELGGGVVIAAPCWGFCHRISPDGREAGNAAWFGMGAGLDELDLLVSDVSYAR